MASPPLDYQRADNGCLLLYQLQIYYLETVSPPLPLLFHRKYDSRMRDSFQKSIENRSLLRVGCTVPRRGVNGQNDSYRLSQRLSVRETESGSGTTFERRRLPEVDDVASAVHRRTANTSRLCILAFLSHAAPAHTQLSNIRGNPDGHQLV